MNHGESLKQFLEAKNINRTKLATDMGMSKQNLYQLFRSKRFSLDTIGKLEKTLGVNWEDIERVNTDIYIDQRKTSGDIPDVLSKYVHLLESSINEDRAGIKIVLEELREVAKNLALIRSNQMGAVDALKEKQGLILRKLDELSRRTGHKSTASSGVQPPHGRSRK